MTTTNPPCKPGDLIELRKGDEYHGGRVSVINGRLSFLDWPFGLESMTENGYTLTIKERAPEPLPTVPGLYVARDDLAAQGIHIFNAFERYADGSWRDERGTIPIADAIFAHVNRGGLVRLSPEDAPRLSDEELALLREVLDNSESETKWLQQQNPGVNYATDRARIAQARRILGLVPTEGSEK